MTRERIEVREAGPEESLSRVLSRSRPLLDARSRDRVDSRVCSREGLALARSVSEPRSELRARSEEDWFEDGSDDWEAEEPEDLDVDSELARVEEDDEEAAASIGGSGLSRLIPLAIIAWIRSSFASGSTIR